MNRMDRSARSHLGSPQDHFRSAQSRCRRLVLVLVALLPLAATINCGSGDGTNRTIANPEWAPFIDIAKIAICADKSNKLYAIDHVLVFYEKAGSCQDAAFSEILFGATPDDILCQYSDNVAGPQKNCPDQDFAALFEIIIANLDQADLGLGPDHTVERIPF